MAMKLSDDDGGGGGDDGDATWTGPCALRHDHAPQFNQQEDGEKVANNRRVSLETDTSCTMGTWRLFLHMSRMETP
jgi:hypothetical protein